jgi:hypothetical protein
MQLPDVSQAIGHDFRCTLIADGSGQTKAACHFRIPLFQDVSSLNQVLMERMRLIYNLKNIMIQKFQYYGEFRLIEMGKMKMQMIEFE